MAKLKQEMLLQLVIGIRAIFCQGGGGGGGEPFAQKILASCPNFYETVENERGSYDALTWAPTHEVKMIRHMNLPYSS